MIDWLIGRSIIDWLIDLNMIDSLIDSCDWNMIEWLIE